VAKWPATAQAVPGTETGRSDGLGWRQAAESVVPATPAPAKAHLPHVHNQVDGPPPPTPWHQFMNLGPLTDSTPRAVCPLGRVVRIANRLQGRQDHSERHPAQAIGSGAPVHGSAASWGAR